MEALVLLAALAVMLLGLFGVVVPVMPGLLFVWLAAVGSLLWQGADLAGWLVAGLLTVLFALGTAATIVLPTRQGRQGGVPGSTLAWTSLGAAVGFFVLPVAGLLVGALVGLYLAERRRLGTHDAASRSAGRVLRAYGVGVLVELLIGLLMIAVWVVAVLVRL